MTKMIACNMQSAYFMQIDLCVTVHGMKHLLKNSNQMQQKQRNNM